MRFDHRGDMVVAAAATRMSRKTQSASWRAGHLSRHTVASRTVKRLLRKRRMIVVECP